MTKASKLIKLYAESEDLLRRIQQNKPGVTMLRARLIEKTTEARRLEVAIGGADNG